MFYKLHKKAVIGCKKLSDADLGISQSSHQTHIGLYENTLDFLSHYHQESSAQILHLDNIYDSVSMLDYIQNSDGSFRSPKIRIGDKEENGTAKQIRKITASDIQATWYLLWFGLENEEIIFLLMEKGSEDYNFLQSKLGNLNRSLTSKTDKNFKIIIDFLNSKVNKLSFSYLEELEILSQSNKNNSSIRNKIRRYDIEKAQKLFKQIGNQGEKLVDDYLQKEKEKKNIKDYCWVNRDNESGYPYDFEIIDNSGKNIYSDAKSTSYKFEQQMFFSAQELKFINENKNYSIYRVFDINSSAKLKTCNNIDSISNDFIRNLNHFSTQISNNDLILSSLKIAVKPTHKNLNFNSQIIL